MHLEVGWDGKENVLIIPASNQYKAFPELRDAIVDGIQNPINRFVSQLAELREDYIQHCP